MYYIRLVFTTIHDQMHVLVCSVYQEGGVFDEAMLYTAATMGYIMVLLHPRNTCMYMCCYCNVINLNVQMMLVQRWQLLGSQPVEYTCPQSRDCVLQYCHHAVLVIVYYSTATMLC